LKGFQPVARSKDAPVDQSVLLEYLNSSSDFAFELLCLKTLKDLGCDCQHGGSYTDPITKKTRQFDIRFQKECKNMPLNCRFLCAVECKNLNTTFPLLVQSIPRSPDESFHNVIISYQPGMFKQEITRSPAFEEICGTICIRGNDSVYHPGEQVGKSCAQVGRANGKSIISNDAEVFEKWSQALASVQDLADESTEEGKKKKDTYFSAILPILVVPDETLWEVMYDSNGTRKTDPTQTERCSFFVGKNYFARSQFQGTTFIVSHLEFLTLSGLRNLIDGTKSVKEVKKWFPTNDAIRNWVNAAMG
jgi:hypothetical protein